MIWAFVLFVAALFIYNYFIRPLGFWKTNGVPYVKGAVPFFGNHFGVFVGRKSLYDFMLEVYNTLPDVRYCGYYLGPRPLLLIRDVDLIRQMTIKDFDHFTDHFGVFKRGLDEVMDRGLFVLQGLKWREMRANVSPSFTTNKMRAMLPLMVDCADNFTRHYKEQGDEVIVLEMKDAFTRFTNDVIASAAFGIQCDSLEEKNNKFYIHSRKLIEQDWKTIIKVMAMMVAPLPILKAFNIKLFPNSSLNFFTKIIKDNIKERGEKGIIRPDLIQLMLEAQKGKLKHEKIESKQDEGFATAQESQIGKAENMQLKEISDEDIISQAFLFIFAGFEPTSTVSSFMAYELAINPDIQEKLYVEIEAGLRKTSGKIIYEDMMGMKYLDQVISETLRLWGPNFQSDRVCVKDYVIQPKLPTEEPYTVRKGQSIILPFIGLHKNPEFFPNPDKFDPDRFSDENKHKIIPGTYMPFGIGPRNCIGSRFVLLEVKTLFIKLLSKFELVVVEETPIPMELAKIGLGLGIKGGFWLGLKARINSL